MKQYLTGFITAVCLTASVFMFLGAGHTHDATEIEYSSYQRAGYGTLQSKLNEIDDKAEESHNHDSYDIYGIDNHSHSEYADEYHSHY